MAYSEEFKREVVERYRSGISRRELSTEFGIGRSTPRRWYTEMVDRKRYVSRERRKVANTLSVLDGIKKAAMMVRKIA